MSPTWSVEGLEADLEHFHLGPVDLELSPGRVAVVLGPSGAGKTTFLRVLAGFIRVQRGRILRDGEDVSRWLPEERDLGYVPQGLGLLPQRTVEGNVRYPLDVRGRADARARAAELLEQFHLTELARRYPTRLSGGEQQRVAIARALAARPGLIVWDEPWQGLDVVARHELGLALHELREVDRVPVVVVTHDPGLAFSIADDFLLLERGQVRERCDAAALIAAPADVFAARFVGLENVFDLPDLGSGAPGSLRAWLRDRSGAGGIAFSSPTYPTDPASPDRWRGRVRSLRPSPPGLIAEVLVDDLLVVLRIRPPVPAPLPSLGTTVEFGIDPDSLRALGSKPPSPAAR